MIFPQHIFWVTQSATIRARMQEKGWQPTLSSFLLLTLKLAKP